MKVFYSRVSSTDGSQKHDRQLTDVKGFDYVFSDSCSGSIDLFDRPKGSQLKRLIDQGKLKHLEIHAIDRLGRSALSLLDNYNYLTQQGVRIVCRNPQQKYNLQRMK
jgi:DNA invertase Pin-like site-specific DNA recombinase